ncbi:MAG: sulfotransferase [Novosphingobium sp.]|nr:sulfotransferase [Novosphingobium sp.]
MRSHPDAIVERAMSLSGEREFASESFRDGLAVILSELDRHPALLPGARARLEDAAAGFLANRLKTDAWIRANPQVTDAPVERPVFIMGMPRTGTTLVSNLLAQDPARRTLLNWEAIETAPPAAPGRLRADPRAGHRQGALDQANERFPALARIHNEVAAGPCECHTIHKQDFRALWWDAQVSMPGYADWILGCDMEPAYRLQKRYLQVLQSTNPGTWQLKLPSHALHIRALLKVFPDARLVWTHRDPVRAVSSLLSLIATVSGMNVRLDPEFLRWNYLHQAAEHLRRPLQVKHELGRGRIYDLHYADLMRDPIAAMRALYAYLGDDLSEEVEAGMRRWPAENPQGRHGTHAYSLAQYGLTADAVRPLFEDYLSQYDIEPEG